MREQIGEVSGKVWNTLGEKGEVLTSQLSKITKEKNELVYQALGWLAREDKIQYLKKGEKTYVSLSMPEQKIFKTIH